jgi:hypothetical protein
MMTQIEQLLDLTKRWNNHEDIPRSQQLECRKIGERINSEGGFAGMQEAYRQARMLNPDVHVIQTYWDGVGDWEW